MGVRTLFFKEGQNFPGGSEKYNVIPKQRLFYLKKSKKHTIFGQLGDKSPHCPPSGHHVGPLYETEFDKAEFDVIEFVTTNFEL
jgi:hypothetical protein